MKRKPYLIVGLLGIIMLGGVGFMWFKHNEAERKEKELIRMETITAKQIKNTFTDVTEIEFSEEYGENTLTGYTSVMVTITAGNGKNSCIGVDMSLNNKDRLLESYAGKIDFDKGITENKVKVVFSNKDERNL